MSTLKDLTGLKFGKLTPISHESSKGQYGNVTWLCKCDCGNTTKVNGSSLTRGYTKSCGCINRAKLLIHGEFSNGKKPSPEYVIWNHIRGRCYSKKHISYKKYGGRGIIMCDRWRDSFTLFLEDMGKRPSPIHSIDRYPNNDGNYEPSNCRWATPTEQSRNRGEYNKRILYNGKNLCMPEWEEITGVTVSAMKTRFKNGWSVEDTLTTPMRKDKRRKL